MTTRTYRKPERTMADLLAEIMERAPTAAAVLERQGQAFATEASAEAKILLLAIEIARPALPALVNAVPWSRLKAVEVADDLWLMEDGIFWERPKNLPDDDVGEPVTIDEVAEAWDPATILGTLAKLLHRQIEGRLGSAQKAELHAKRLAALAALVEEG